MIKASNIHSADVIGLYVAYQSVGSYESVVLNNLLDIEYEVKKNATGRLVLNIT